jgi:putative Ca2+/H+ antiporter (TMEM165/GDT1 family)
VSLTIAAITFGVIFLAELPDKTALASLMLGTRYRGSYVFAGVAAAFAVHVVLAVAAGGAAAG